MPWCPECKIEYREGFDRCADCGCALVRERPAKNALAKPKDGEDWRPLISLYNETEADIVMGLLETADIPVVKTYKGMGVLYKVYTGKAGVVDLFVPAEKFEQARDLLDAKTR